VSTKPNHRRGHGRIGRRHQCGRSGCVTCNPDKALKVPTVQERRSRIDEAEQLRGEADPPNDLPPAMAGDDEWLTYWGEP